MQIQFTTSHSPPVQPAAVPSPSARIAAAADPSALVAREPATSVKAYYASAQGKQGVELLRALHDASESHHHPLGYDSARSAMFRVVEDPSGRDIVTDLYSGRKIHQVHGLHSATKAGLTTEHVWPQSEGATEEARSDLHHLRPALQSLNSHRSNLPYGEVVETDWQSPKVRGVSERSKVGDDATGTKVFSPRPSMRGDLARDQFYFFMRYFGDRPEGYSNGNFLHSLDTLLKWNHEDPVDAAERARNDVIARLQGNRNPFVDHPEYVDRIGFTEQLVKRRAIES